VVVSRTGAFAEIPDGCCAKVDLDESEEELLLATLRALAGDRELRQAIGRNAQRFVGAQTPERSAATCADVLRRAVAWRWSPGPARPPLAPSAAHDLFTTVLRAAAAELADLGVGDEEDTVLGPVAEAAVELGLDDASRGEP